MKHKDKKNSIWALIYSKPKEEQRAKINLERQGFEVFLPMIDIEEGREPLTKASSVHFLFPRYLFVKINIREGNWISINSTRGVSNLVLFGGKIATVQENIILYLQQITNKEGIFRQKTQMVEFSEGDDLIIQGGILKGMRGIFLSKSGKERVRILLQTFSKPLTVDLSLENIGKKKIVDVFKL